MDAQIAPPSPPADHDSDVTSAAGFGGSDGDSDYVKLAENSPTSPADMPDLKGKIVKLETMHEVSEGEMNDIVQTTVILSHTNKIKIPELVNAKTNPPENIQENGATPPVITHTSPPHSDL